MIQVESFAVFAINFSEESSKMQLDKKMKTKRGRARQSWRGDRGNQAPLTAVLFS